MAFFVWYGKATFWFVLACFQRLGAMTRKIEGPTLGPRPFMNARWPFAALSRRQHAAESWRLLQKLSTFASRCQISWTVSVSGIQTWIWVRRLCVRSCWRAQFALWIGLILLAAWDQRCTTVRPVAGCQFWQAMCWCVQQSIHMTSRSGA